MSEKPTNQTATVRVPQGHRYFNALGHPLAELPLRVSVFPVRASTPFP